MAVGGDQSASETLDASRHCLGRLLQSFLIPTTHDLTFREVISRCLYENRRDAEHRLNDLVKCRDRIRGELDGLVEAHKESSGSSRKKMKKETDLQHKELEGLKGRISDMESHLQEDMPEQDVPEGDDALDQGAEVVMPPSSGVAAAPVSSSSPGEDPAMEVDEGAVGPPPPAQSPERMMISSTRMGQWKWRQAWPTSQSHLLGDKSGRVRTSPSLRHLPLRKVKKLKIVGPVDLIPRGLQRRSCISDVKKTV